MPGAEISRTLDAHAQCSTNRANRLGLHCIYIYCIVLTMTRNFQDSGMSSLNGSGDATSTAVAVPEGKSAGLSATAGEDEGSPEIVCKLTGVAPPPPTPISFTGCVYP